MVALRLTRAGRPAVQFRRLLVAAASAGTGFLLLGALGHALGHPGTAGAALRLAWCVVPVAATVYFAPAVARTDPGTRPRPGLSAVGLGPARLTLVSVLTTALATVLGSLLALLFFLHLRGDLSGLPFDRAGRQFLAAGRPFPVPAALTLLAVVPVLACAAVGLALRPRRDPRPARRRVVRGLGGHTDTAAPRETFGAYGRFGARARAGAVAAEPGPGTTAVGTVPAPGDGSGTPEARTGTATEAPDDHAPQDPADGDPLAGDRAPEDERGDDDASLLADEPTREVPAGLPWGVAALAAGLAAQAYGGPALSVRALTALPAEATTVLIGWAVTAFGLVLAAPGLTYLCGQLTQAVRPGALRLLAGRGLMAEAVRIGRPLGVVCAVGSAAYALTVLYRGPAASFGPLALLGAGVVVGCTVATLLTAAVEARQDRAGTTAALVRLGAPRSMLRGAALLRAGVLVVVFGALALLIAELAALPGTR